MLGGLCLAVAELQREAKAEEVGFEPTRAYSAQEFSKLPQWTYYATPP